MEKEQQQLFEFSEVPDDWALCFLETCPLKEHCQRWLAYSYAPNDVKVRPCITPHALEGGKCIYYVEPITIRMAYGFGDIYQSVRRDHYQKMKSAIMRYLGSYTYYYRYKRGEYGLTPEQQSWMRALFRKYGYDDNILFYNYANKYVFPVARNDD